MIRATLLILLALAACAPRPDAPRGAYVGGSVGPNTR